MREFRTKGVMLGVLCACLAPVSWAGEQTKETHLSIDGPLQIRDILLPPGQYVFRLTEPDIDRSVVSIYNAQTNRLEGTIIGLPAYRLAAGDKHLFTVSQPEAGQPAKLQSWFYPGDNFGVEFPRRMQVIETGKAIESNGRAPHTGSTADGSSTR